MSERLDYTPPEMWAEINTRGGLDDAFALRLVDLSKPSIEIYRILNDLKFRLDFNPNNWDKYHFALGCNNNIAYRFASFLTDAIIGERVFLEEKTTNCRHRYINARAVLAWFMPELSEGTVISQIEAMRNAFVPFIDDQGLVMLDLEPKSLKYTPEGYKNSISLAERILQACKKLDKKKEVIYENLSKWYDPSNKNIGSN